MQLQEFQFVLEDIKSQMALVPALPSMLKLTQKTTKKLQCLNLYSQADRREFDLQIEEENIYKEITELYKAIETVKGQQPLNEDEIQLIQQSILQIREKYSRTFDALNRQQEVLGLEFLVVEGLLKQSDSVIGSGMIKEVKEIDEYEVDDQDEDGHYSGDKYEDAVLMEPPGVRIQKLKGEIDSIQKKILSLNNGKGKWFDTDHRDFVKIYIRCNGNDKRIITEGAKVLGMNQTEIMDHLQLYENYLQLEKEKKLVTQQYRQIKFLQQEETRQKQEQKESIKKLQQKAKKDKQLQQRIKKKEQIQKYRQKKLQEKEKIYQKEQEEKHKMLKIPPIQPQKKKQIMERNRLMLENQQKRVLQVKLKRQSIEKGKMQQSVEGKKQTSTIGQGNKRLVSSGKKGHLEIPKSK